MDSTEKKPKKKLPKMEEMTQEQIRKVVLKKRECNSNAQKIVESLLETNITEQFLLQCVPNINQSHFEDIIEERSIVYLCGYPVCQKTLAQKDIPKQQYRISVKNNKVYDITARKSFCSNTCYQAAMFIKNQMLTSPLWFRKHEEIPRFTLMPLNINGSLGQEVDLSIIEKIEVKKDLFTSINDFADASLNDIDNNDCKFIIDQSTDENGETESKSEQGKEAQEKISTEISMNLKEKCHISNEELSKKKVSIEQSLENIKEKSSTKTVEDNISNNEIKMNCLSIKDEKESTELINKETISIENKESNEKVLIKDPKTKQKIQSNPLNIIGDIIEKPGKKLDPILTSQPEPTKTKKVAPKKDQPSIIAIVIQIERCLAEWFTLDSMILLFGEERVKELVTDKGECIKEYLNNYANGLFYSANSYDQYQQLCRKLNILELEDRRYDGNVLKKETKPLPDYSILREESKKLELKVKAFFAGETDMLNPETSEPNVQSKTDVEGQLTQLPLVDKKAQNALRRKIVLQQLNKVLPDLLRSLGLLQLSINSEVRLLVNTFKLKANNIMFKPVQWLFIAIVVIKLLSLKDERLRHLMGQPMAFQHLELLLLTYKQDGGYLERLITWLTDIDRLLDTNDTQLTVT